MNICIGAKDSRTFKDAWIKLKAMGHNPAVSLFEEETEAKVEAVLCLDHNDPFCNGVAAAAEEQGLLVFWSLEALREWDEQQ